MAILKCYFFQVTYCPVYLVCSVDNTITRYFSCGECQSVNSKAELTATAV